MMIRKLKLKVSYRANFARHIFPIVITFLYLTIGQFGLVVHYLKDWLYCILNCSYVTIIGITLGV